MGILICLSISGERLAKVQENFGNSAIDVNISTLLENQRAASGTYGPTDNSDCDITIYFCEDIGGCTYNWEFISFVGGVFTFHETISSNSENCVPGFVTLSYTTDDELTYKWVEEEDSTNISTGNLTRK